MKAVNLIPTEAAPGGGRSGVGAYAVVGVLAVLVVMSSLYALAGRSVATKKQELAAVTAQANAADAQAATLKTYVDYADKRKARVETVKNLLASRFDWSSALDEVARTVPSGTWLTSLEATVTPAVTVGGSGAAGSLRGTLAVPAIDVSGCASGQQGVARTLTALRAMSGVQRVTLSTSGRAGDGSGSTASTPAGQSCGGAQFALTVFYAAPASSTATAATPTAPATASAAATTTTTGGSTP